MSPAAGILLVVNFPSSGFMVSWSQQPVLNKVQLCLWNGKPKLQVGELGGMMDWIQWERKLAHVFRPNRVQSGLLWLYGWPIVRDVCTWHRLGHCERDLKTIGELHAQFRPNGEKRWTFQIRLTWFTNLVLKFPTSFAGDAQCAESTVPTSAKSWICAWREFNQCHANQMYCHCGIKSEQIRSDRPPFVSPGALVINGGISRPSRTRPGFAWERETGFSSALRVRENQRDPVSALCWFYQTSYFL